MITLASLSCLIAGASLAWASLRDPERAAVLERWSGVCLVLGLGLLGASMKIFR